MLIEVGIGMYYHFPLTLIPAMLRRLRFLREQLHCDESGYHGKHPHWLSVNCVAETSQSPWYMPLHQLF